MSLVISTDNNLPNDTINVILNNATTTAVVRFASTCKTNSNFSFYTQEVVNKIFTSAMGIKDESLLVRLARNLGVEKIILSHEVAMFPRDFVSYIQPAVNCGVKVGKLHISITGRQDAMDAEKIESKEAITTITFSGLREQINTQEAEKLLTQFSRLSKLIVNSTVWMNYLHFREDAAGGVTPSYPQVQEVQMKTTLNSDNLTKVFRLFPQLEKITLATQTPNISLVLEGAKRIEKMKQALQDQPPMNLADTCTFILTV